MYDPLQLMSKYPDKYRRYQELEIKHGRFAMAACLHVFVTEVRSAASQWTDLSARKMRFALRTVFQATSSCLGGIENAFRKLVRNSWSAIVAIIKKKTVDNSLVLRNGLIETHIGWFPLAGVPLDR